MNQVLAKQDEYDRIYNNLSSEYRQILAEQEAAEAQASARAPQEFVPSPVEVTPPATSIPRIGRLERRRLVFVGWIELDYGNAKRGW